MKRQAELNRLFFNTINDLMILKDRPTRINQMENRLNNKLNQIANNLVDKAINYPLLNPMRYEERVLAAYRQHLESVYRVGENEIIKNPQVELTSSPITPSKLQDIIENRTFRASEYTMNRLTGEVLPKIQEGIKEGKSLGKTADSLKTEFKDMTESQLTRISRTETQSTYNQSKFETMMQSEAVTGKRWKSSGRSNMRRAHKKANGQTVAVDKPFLVDGEKLMYPGDPDGSVENIVNCACTILPDIRYGRE